MRTCSLIPGFRTFTTTSSPSASTAPCTCASDAVAIGWGSNTGEHVGERPAQLTLDHLGDLRGRNRRQRVEELAELLGVVGPEEVVAGGQQLSDLHVAAATGLEVPPQEAGSGRGPEQVAEQQRRGDDQAQDEQPAEPADGAEQE